MKYVLVEVVEREISTPEFFDTYKDAFEQMCRYVAKANGISYEDVLRAIDGDLADENIVIERYAAWTERFGNNFDWKIFEIADEPGCSKALAEEIFCDQCGGKLVWQAEICDANGNPVYQKSSEYLDGHGTCRSCMTEYCCETNCLQCKIGDYPNCRFMYLKEN